MQTDLKQLELQTRRTFLNGFGQLSLGAIAMRSLDRPAIGASPTPTSNPLSPKKPPLPSKAKNVIYLSMSGGPPNLDIFDYKPELVKRDGEPCPDSFLKGREFAFTSGVPKLMGTPRTFKQYGKAGIWMSDAVPNFHRIADDITLVRAMHTDQFNHAPAELLLFTGHARQGRPSLGSWVTYGLGTENQDLPDSSASFQVAFNQVVGKVFGVAALSPRFIKASNAEAKATPFSSPPTQLV